MSLRSMRQAFCASLFFLLVGPPAWAQSSSAANTLGQGTFNAMKDMVGPILAAIALGSFVLGIFLVGRGLLKLKEGSGHNASGHGAAFMTILAGVILITLPDAAGIGMNTLMNTGGIFAVSDIQAAQVVDSAPGGTASTLTGKLGNLATPGAVNNCLTSTSAVPCMAQNLAVNLVPVGVVAVFGFVFIAGLWQLGSAIGELAKHDQNRGALPNGWWMKVFTAILMMNGPTLLQAASQTITGQAGAISSNGLDSSSSILQYSNVGGAFAQYEQTIGYLFTILTLFGVIAFMRGIFILKSAAEGKSNSTMGHGLVFMVAGVLLANCKVSTCFIIMTMTGTPFGFCPS